MIQFRFDDDTSANFFDDEFACMALPVGSLGVLYLGRERDDFGDQDVQDLKLLVDKAELTLEVAVREQERMGVYHALQERVTLLGHLMEGARAITSSLEPPAVALSLERLLHETIPHDAGIVVAPAMGLEWEWGKPSLSGEVEELSERTEAGRAESFRAAGYTVLVSPLVTDRGVEGLVALASHEDQQYSDEHKDLLYTIACQTAVTLANAERYKAMVAARAELEEKQSQLIQSSKMTAVGTMVAGIAHELNTPLGAISLSVEAAQMQMERQPENALAKLELAQKATDKLQVLVDRLLVYSSRSKDQPEPLELAETIEDAFLFLEHRFRRGRVRLVKRLDGPGPVVGKGSELQQVFMNLMLNAIDASLQLPEQQRVVELNLKQESEWVVVVVTDRGPGIPPETLPRIFDPFFTTKEVGQGTGLGLSVSLEIVEQHGGCLEVESKVGTGTRFTVRLPGIR